MQARLQHGDCRRILPTLDAGSARLVYFDPPFFTQRVQRLRSGGGDAPYAFSDVWSGQEQYVAFIEQCLRELRRVLSDDGSLFFHCDRRCAHIARHVLDRVFGPQRFRSEIIWHYRRWSNARRALLPSHQTLYLYTKGEAYVFHPEYVEYSPSTNVDQLLQRRTRDAAGKAVYARDAAGAMLPAGIKRGVPLGDVWDIPYLNPKARERVGYPTQKPVLLLERIVRLASDPGDVVLDPCAGSGTALVAAALCGRRGLGIDISAAAVALARARLRRPMRSESALLGAGREAYRQSDGAALALLAGLDVIPVQRSRGMDAILRQQHEGRPVALRVQRPGEPASAAAQLLARAGASKGCKLMILVVTDSSGGSVKCPPGVVTVETPAVQVARLASRVRPR